MNAKKATYDKNDGTQCLFSFDSRQITYWLKAWYAIIIAVQWLWNEVNAPLYTKFYLKPQTMIFEDNWIGH